MMPSGLNGFGYLDAVRKAVCVDEPHEDLVPTPSQQARIGYLRPQNRYKLARQKYDERPLPTEEKVVKKITFKTNADIKKWKYTGITNVRIEDGCLCGTATADNPIMELKNFLLDSTEVAYAKVVMANTYGGGDKPCMFRMRTSNKPEKDN
jgi:hypothetical protein